MLKIPPVTRNLILVNVVCFLVQMFCEQRSVRLDDLLGLHFVLADDFNVVQLVSYMFLHGSLTHLFFNMFSLWMFGGLIERTLGVRRFLIYYFVCGIGAGLCQELWQTGQFFVLGYNHFSMINLGNGLVMPMSDYLNLWTTIGASGACYGVLLAFGMLYPNERIMLLIPPIPMKAKYFVAGYAVIELASAYLSNDNIAHFAHLGGMLFGWLLLRLWRRRAQSRTAFGGWEQWQGTSRPGLGQRLKNWWANLMPRRRTARPGNAHRTATRETDYDYNMRRKQEEARMDEILDKVRKSGYDSLTTEEKRELFRISRK